MKKLCLALLLGALCEGGFAAEPVLQYQKHAGFEANPTNETLTLKTDGTVELVVKYLRTGETTKSRIARVNRNLVVKMAAAVGELEDLDLKREPGPLCTDAPAYTWLVYKRGEEEGLSIFRRAGCRDSKFEDPKNAYRAERLKRVLDGLLDLTEF